MGLIGDINSNALQGNSSVAKWCLTHVTPWTAAHQAPLTMRFPQQEYWSGLPFPSQGIFPTQGSEEPAKGSNLDTYLPLTLQAPQNPLDQTAQVVKQLAKQPGFVAEPSLILGSIKN